MDCVFCKIGAKEIPSRMIYEDERVFAVLDIAPRAPGHAMIIPKMHVENILDLPEDKVGPLFSAVKAVTAKLLKALGPDGFTLGINHGDASGQTVKHLHVHVVPRWKDDGGGSVHSVVDNPPQEGLDALAEKIAAA